MNTLTFRVPVIAAAMAVSFAACQKEYGSNTTPTEQTALASASIEGDAQADAIFNDVFDNVIGVDDQLGFGGTGVFGSPHPGNALKEETLSGTAQADSGRCFTVTYTRADTTKRFPVSVTIDFGNGCTGRDGKTRKGRIITVYTGPILLPGNSSTTTFENYYVNDTHVEGTHITINSSTLQGIQFTNKIIEGKITRANGDYVIKNSEKTHKMVAGLLTLDPRDDIYSITGNSTGSTKKGDAIVNWSNTITDPLIKKMDCHWIVKGTVQMKKGDAPLAELDYGSGTCDNQAVMTINGQPREISLP